MSDIHVYMTLLSSLDYEPVIMISNIDVLKFISDYEQKTGKQHTKQSTYMGLLEYPMLYITQSGDLMGQIPFAGELFGNFVSNFDVEVMTEAEKTRYVQYNNKSQCQEIFAKYSQLLNIDDFSTIVKPIEYDNKLKEDLLNELFETMKTSV